MFTTQSFETPLQPRLSILIPSWNNLDLLKICVSSLANNSRFLHQIIVHVNDGSDGTLDWLRSQRIDHSHSATNLGICCAVNAARSLARADHLVFMNDDMYACPDWDRYLLHEVESIDHPRFMLSSTAIEPVDTGNGCAIAPHDFGRDVETFRECELLARFDTFEFSDWQGSTWPPILVHRSLWDLVGGLSVEFSPGLCSDPDLSMKLWQVGVRYFKGVAASRVYHFVSKTTGRMAMNDGPRQFFEKWGIQSTTFSRRVLRRGEPFAGPLPAEPPPLGPGDWLRGRVWHVPRPCRVARHPLSSAWERGSDGRP